MSLRLCYSLVAPAIAASVSGECVPANVGAVFGGDESGDGDGGECGVFHDVVEVGTGVGWLLVVPDADGASGADDGGVCDELVSKSHVRSPCLMRVNQVSGVDDAKEGRTHHLCAALEVLLAG
jgi:hypothetical protein